MLSTGDALPDAFECALYCPPSKISTDGSRADGSAFRLRSGHTYLSVSCVDLASDDELRVGRIDALKDIYAARRDLKIKASGRLALFGVGRVREYVRTNATDARELTVLFDPIPPDDPTHSGVHGLRDDDDVIADLMADCVSDLLSVRR
jgi:hypothetical protein